MFAILYYLIRKVLTPKIVILVKTKKKENREYNGLISQIKSGKSLRHFIQ